MNEIFRIKIEFSIKIIVMLIIILGIINLSKNLIYEN